MERMRSLIDLAGDMHPDAREGYGRIIHAAVEAIPSERNAFGRFELTTAEKACAVRPFDWLLELVSGGGVKLTAAGFLPPALVTATMEELGWQDRWIGKQNREDLTIPVRDLRDRARAVGLTRKYKGVLLPSRLGASLTGRPERLWDHLAAAITSTDDEPTLRAVTLLLLGVATRQYRSRDAYLRMISNGLLTLGWVTTERRPLEVTMVDAMIDDAWAMLDTIGAFEVGEQRYDRWGPGSRVGAAFAWQALTRNDPFPARPA